jgi:hypothetical protein
MDPDMIRQWKLEFEEFQNQGYIIQDELNRGRRHAGCTRALNAQTVFVLCAPMKIAIDII